MRLTALLSGLHQRGVKLHVDGDTLRFDAPSGAMTPALRAELRTHKQEIIEFFRATRQETSVAVTPRRSPGPAPLSFAQRGLWFLDQLVPGSDQYNLPLVVRFRGSLDVAALRQSIEDLVHRHEVLRSTFRAMGGEPVQLVHAPAPLPMPVHDLTEVPPAQREQELITRTISLAREPFDLAQGPLVRPTLFEASPTDRVLLVAMPHIISDGWSLGVMVRELSELYSARVAGLRPTLPDLPIQYADFAAWQRHFLTTTEATKLLEAYARDLADLPALLLPTDFERPAVTTPRGAHAVLSVPISVTDGLRSLARQNGATLFMILLAGFKTLIHRYTGQVDIVVGSPNANRNHDGTEGLVGFFANMLVLRTSLEGDPTFTELLTRVRDVALTAYARQDVPFARLVEKVAPERNLDENPLFQVTFALQNAPMPPLLLEGLHAEVIDLNVHTTRFDLEVHAYESTTGLELHIGYREELFEKQTIERLARHFGRLLQAVVTDAQQRLSALAMLSAEEQQDVRAENLATHTAYPHVCVHQLFEQQARETPQAPALSFREETTTYAQLDTRANHLAAKLCASGVGPGTFVALLADRSPGAFIGMLAVLKAGGAYIPIDSSWPKQRLAHILAEATVSILLTQEKFLKELVFPDVRVLCIESESASDGSALESPTPQVTADHPAYAIFTSGSTGRPKGVIVPHRALVNYLVWAKKQYIRGDAHDLPLMSSLAVDLTCTSIYLSLISGGKITVYRDICGAAPPVNRVVQDDIVDVLKLTPSHLALIRHDGAHVQRLARLVVGGEELRSELAREVAQAYPGVEIFNEYGPTEATVGCAAHRFDPSRASGSSVPIGKPIDNTQLYVLDDALQLVPVGGVGEIYVGGDGLAWGYLGKPGLTAAAFVPNPFRTGERMYRTGDLGRWRAPGELEFLGRKDHQLKIRGFRVEPAGVEAVLARHPAVEEVAVVAAARAGGEPSLAAFLTLTPDHTAPSDAVLKDLVSEQLPSYMVPETLTWLPSLPQTSSGKTDRAALRQMQVFRATGGQGSVAPRTPVEDTLAEIWRRVLHVRDVGMQDNFFELGGHSLLAAQCISTINHAFDLELPLRTLFEHPTIERLAPRVDRQLEERSAVPRIDAAAAPSSAASPLSLAQAQIWYRTTDRPGGCTRVLELHAKQPFEPGPLASTLAQLVRRHGILHTTFTMIDGQPSQQVRAPLPVPLEDVDCSTLLKDAFEAEVEQRSRAEQDRAFDLGQAPLVRATLLRRGELAATVLVAVPEIVADEASLEVLARDFSVVYEALAAGRPSPLTELPFQYSHFAAAQRRSLASAPAIAVLQHRKRRLDQGTGGSLATVDVAPTTSLVEPVTVSPRTTQAVRALSASTGTPLLPILFGALAVWLGHDGVGEVRVSTWVGCRDHSDTLDMVGPFTSALVLQTSIQRDETFRELLQRVKTTVLGVYADRQVPASTVADIEGASHALVLRSPRTTKLSVPGLTTRTRGDPNHSGLLASAGRLLQFEETPEGLHGELVHARHDHDRRPSEMAGELSEVLQRLVHEPDLPVSRCVVAWDDSNVVTRDSEE